MVLSSCLRGELGINVRYYMILRLTTTVMATATALLLFAVRVEGRTWRLASDGSGDVMYIKKLYEGREGSFGDLKAPMEVKIPPSK